MKIIHYGGFAPDEMVYYRRQIFDNLCSAVRLLLDAMDEWVMSVEPENEVSNKLNQSCHLLKR